MVFRPVGLKYVEYMSSLSQLLDPAAVALDVRPADWREAIATAGALLRDTGVATDEYTAAMIRTVEEKGPYIVIAPGFAFAHARPSAAVHTTGLAWVRLAEPINFGHPHNDPVELIAALAATDAKQHTAAMAELARLLGNKKTQAALAAASTPREVLEIIHTAGAATAPASRPVCAGETTAPVASTGSTATTRDKILTVCGNGLGTSLFLKNTLEDVLGLWGWSGLITVEATDTISAKGKAKEADLIFTSGEIAKTLGDLGIPVHVIENFTSKQEIDHALRELYDLDALI